MYIISCDYIGSHSEAFRIKLAGHGLNLTSFHRFGHPLAPRGWGSLHPPSPSLPRINGFCSSTSLESATAKPAARCAFRQVAGARIQWDSCRVTSCFLGLKILILKLCRGNPMVMDAHFIVSEAKR